MRTILPFIMLVLTFALIIIMTFLIVYFVNKGSYKNSLKRGGMVTTGKILHVDKHTVMISAAMTPVTKIIVEVENNGISKEFNLITYENTEFTIGSYIQIIVNFQTGECGLYRQ